MYDAAKSGPLVESPDFKACLSESEANKQAPNYHGCMAERCLDQAKKFAPDYHGCMTYGPDVNLNKCWPGHLKPGGDPDRAEDCVTDESERGPFIE